MKVLYFTYRDRSKKTRQSRPLNLERFFFNAFLAVFVILLGVQAALLNPAFRTAVTVEEGLEGAPLGTEEYLYNEGSMEITLENAESEPNVRVLVNGEERAAFDSYSVIINVIEGDVVEIDASEAAESIRVTISALSENFDRECLGRSYQVEGNVLKLLKIRMPSR
jgi:hypothetical protein